MALHLAVSTPLNERWVAVSHPARALALEVDTIGRRIALEIGSRAATPHCHASALRNVRTLRGLLADLEAELRGRPGRRAAGAGQ